MRLRAVTCFFTAFVLTLAVLVEAHFFREHLAKEILGENDALGKAAA
jgi:hypothetical protein